MKTVKTFIKDLGKDGIIGGLMLIGLAAFAWTAMWMVAIMADRI